MVPETFAAMLYDPDRLPSMSWGPTVSMLLVNLGDVSDPDPAPSAGTHLDQVASRPSPGEESEDKRDGSPVLLGRFTYFLV